MPFPVRFRVSEFDAFYVRFRLGTFGCVRDDGIDGMDILFCYDGFWGIPSQSSPHELAVCEAEREEEEVQGKGEKAFVRGRREGGVTCTLSYLYDHQIFPTGCPPDVRACVV